MWVLFLFFLTKITNLFASNIAFSMKQQIQINAIRSRPRFKVTTTMTMEEFTEKLRAHFKAHNKILGGYVTLQYSVIRLRQSKNKYWAPQLQIRLETDEDNPSITIIRGLFGPKPAIWTFFLFLYTLGATIVFVLGMYGYVQMSLGNKAPWLWAIPAGLAIILATYIAAKIGQKIAQQHMNVLITFVETILVNENIIQINEPTTQST